MKNCAPKIQKSLLSIALRKLKFIVELAQTVFQNCYATFVTTCFLELRILSCVYDFLSLNL